MTERRAASRIRPAATVTCRVAADPPFSAAVEDVSASGLSLLAWRELPRHTPVWLEIPGKSPIAVRVAHAVVRPDGAWHIGCELLDPEDRAVLRELVEVELANGREG
jgi:hypothetical protein